MAGDYGAVTDEELNQLIASLSTGVTQDELNEAGLGLPSIGKFRMGSDTKHQIRDAGRRVSVWGYSKYSSRKKSHDKQKAAINKAQAAGVQDYMAQRQQRLELAKRELARRTTRNRINASFNAPAMTGLYDELEQRNLQSRLGDVMETYSGAMRQSQFDLASRGLQNSSTDVEARGDIQQAQNAAAIQAAQQAQQFRMGIQSQNEEQRRRLVDAVNADDPAASANYDAQIQGIVNQTRGLAQQQASAATMGQINQYGYNMQSQAMGNFLSTLGKFYQTGS